nr:hypothetical protein Iba_chr03bCG12850 [Ipomoea batatas]
MALEVSPESLAVEGLVLEGLDDGAAAAIAAADSSGNMDVSCSSSSLSNAWLAVLLPLMTLLHAINAPPRHSSMNGASTNAMGSLTERRWKFLLAEEKSRNSSTQGFCCAAAAAAEDGSGIAWNGKDDGGQFCVMEGPLGGSCAMHTLIN